LVLGKIRRRFPWLELIWADGGYHACQVDAAAANVPRLCLEIVKRSFDIKGFVVLPRRWVVERTFSCLGETGGSAVISTTSPNFSPPSPSLRFSLPSGGSPGRKP